MALTDRQSTLSQLRASVTCPHCWFKFPPEDVLWISAHSDLLGDSLLGKDHQERFLPSRFTVDGKALDRKGVPCRRLACPHCQLSISPAFLEMDPLFVSILGSPASGKSYYLASMTSALRATLKSSFSLSFLDPDPEANRKLTEYEAKLFRNPQPDQPVTLEKTELEGDCYESVKYHDRQVWYPRPFVFSIQPQESHPAYAKRGLISRALCLYDNAGEHFLPGGESPNSPGTQHLALSRVLLFLFDPMQHHKFRARCQARSSDPQLAPGWPCFEQDQVLLEAGRRIRESGRLAFSEKFKHPLVVVVTKFDVWRFLLNLKKLDAQQVIRPIGPHLSALDLETLRAVSRELRGLLEDLAPEMVMAAEGFCEHVLYLPTAALGHSPEKIPSAQPGQPEVLAIRPKDIKPIWTEIPMLYALHDAAGGLVRGGTPPGSGSPSVFPPPHLLKETGS